ncbi:MAG: Lipopolysaccharide heptosyltransferase 1 [Pseudomonadota bacterium]|jgi:heptosyltransferase-1
MRILLVKTSSMGDVVHALPVLEDIMQHYPLASIDWLVEKSFSSLLSSHNHINNIIPIEWRRWRKDLFSLSTLKEIKTFYKTIKSTHYDYIIDMQGLIKSAIPSYLAKSHGSRIYGYANKSKQAGYEPLAKMVYTNKITIPYECHTVTRNRLLCAGALGYTIDEQNVKLSFKDNSEHIHQEYGGNPYIIFAHGTSRQDKEWGIQNWIELGCKIVEEKPSMTILLPWGNSYEKHNGNLITSGILAKNPDANVRVLVQLSIDKLINIIHGATAFIGADTGLSHISSALNIPSIVLYNFDTIWRTNAFWTKDTQSLYQKQGHISVDNVWSNLHKLVF